MAKNLQITLNDYAKLMYEEPNKANLDSQIALNRTVNYNARFNSISREASQETRVKEMGKLRDYSESTYEEIKTGQMRQLYAAYKSKNHGTMWIEPNETSEDAVRRVVGPYATRAFYTGAMLLNQDEIQAINFIANRSMQEAPYKESFSSYSLTGAVEEIIALRDIVSKEFELTYPENTISSITEETEIGNVAYERNSNPDYVHSYSRETVQEILKRSRVPVEKRNRGTIIQRLLGQEPVKNLGTEKYIEVSDNERN